MKLEQARAIAEDKVRMFAPFCERVEIAGSIRRGKPEVKDIEIVAQPRITALQDIFGTVVDVVSALNGINFDALGLVVKKGPRYKKISLKEGISLDLFIVMPPATWGVIFALRTGPDEWSKWAVTRRAMGGGLPTDMRVDDARVLRGGRAVVAETGLVTGYVGGDPVPTPEEADFLRLVGCADAPPSERRAQWGRG